MSYAFRARKKAIKRALDREDPERAQVRNLIRRGKGPRLTQTLSRRKRYKNRDKKYLVRGAIRYVFGVVFKSKAVAVKAAANEKKASKSKGLLGKLIGT
mgnify:CR=1 FL=1